MTENLDGLIRIGRCEVCGGDELRDVVDLGSHPMCDDLIPVGDPQQCAEFPISISFCPNCRTAHQNFQIPKRILFPEAYHYRARHTADVINGMRQLVDRCEVQLGALRGLRVLDIGCNDGSLLSLFAEREARTFGIEPTGAASDARSAGHDVKQGFFDKAIAAEFIAMNGQPDIVTFTNVFAHIEDLPGILEAVRSLMSDTTLLVIENHYLGSVLARKQFDTFYHEHPRTYSLTSFKHIADSLGGTIVSAEFPARYGGNIRIMIQRAGAGAVEADLEEYMQREAGFELEIRDMSRRIPLWQKAKREQLLDLVARHGPLPAKAFPGRAAILVKLLGLDASMVDAVYEKPGSMKVGHYLPGTRIPILSDEEFAGRPNKDAPLLNLAWHIAEEIHGYMRKTGFSGQIVDVFEPAEFDRLSQ